MNDIYQLLNQCAEEPTETEPLSEQEVSQIMNRFKHEQQAPVKRRKKPYLAILLSAAALAACGTVAAAAGELEGFRKLTHRYDEPFFYNGEEYPLDKWEPARGLDYNAIADNAVAAETNADGDGTEPGLFAETDELTIQIGEIYCDGCATFVNLTATMKDGNPQGKQELVLYDLSASVNGRVWKYVTNVFDNRPAMLYGSLMLDEGTTDQFSGMFKLINFNDGEITEPSVLKIVVGTVIVQENYIDKTGYVLPGFTLRTEVTPDTSKRLSTPYTVEEDGYAVRFYEYSPAMMVVGFLEPHEGDVAGMQTMDGKDLGFSMSEFPDYGDGFRCNCIPAMTSGQTKCVFMAKNDEGQPITKTFVFDMAEVYAAMGGTSE